MLFKNWTLDWFQGKQIVLTDGCDPDLTTYNYIYPHAGPPDAILRLSDKKILLSDILLYTDFVPSRKELQRIYKEGSLKFNDEIVKGEIEIDLTEPDPFIEVRRTTRFLGIVVTHRYLSLWTKEEEIASFEQVIQELDDYLRAEEEKERRHRALMTSDRINGYLNGFSHCRLQTLSLIDHGCSFLTGEQKDELKKWIKLVPREDLKSSITDLIIFE